MSTPLTNKFYEVFARKLLTYWHNCTLLITGLHTLSHKYDLFQVERSGSCFAAATRLNEIENLVRLRHE
jgi:hypothetical protein